MSLLPPDIESLAMATGCITRMPVYVVWTGDEWLLTEQAPDVACWVFMPPPMALAA